MEWLFLIVSIVAVLAAGLMLTRQNAVHSALFLIVNFGCVAFLYLMLDAPFLAMVQVTVYTGAIMVLFLFVIMLLGAEATTDTSDASRSTRWLGFASTAVAILILLIFGFPIASDLLNDDSPDLRTGGQAQLRIINTLAAEDGVVLGVIEPGADYSASAMDRTLLEGAVAVNVALESLDDAQPDVAFDSLAYFDAPDVSTSYAELPAGAYALRASLSASGFNTAPILSQVLQLAADEAHTLLVYAGADNLINMSLLADDLGAPAVGSMRLTLVNALAEETVSLVDIGQYTAIRSLCEDDSCDSLIPHRALAADLAAGAALSVELDEGKYNLAFVDGQQNVLRSLVDYEAERGKLETRLLVSEAGGPGGLANVRAVMFDALGKPAFGSPESIGQVLFVEYVLPVQLVGILLLVALIGVIVLARPDALRQAERRRVNQRRRVSRPLVSVLSRQTGSDVMSGDTLAKLPAASDDPERD